MRDRRKLEREGEKFIASKLISHPRLQSLAACSLAAAAATTAAAAAATERVSAESEPHT